MRRPACTPRSTALPRPLLARQGGLEAEPFRGAIYCLNRRLDYCDSDSGGGSAALQQPGVPREEVRTAMWVAVVVRVRESRASGIAGVSDG